MVFNAPAPSGSSGPKAPQLTSKDLLQQFWMDAYGKEVQTAATYSYTWLADQFGHICIGILAEFLTTLVSGIVIVLFGWQPELKYDTGLWPGLVLALAGPAVWEWSAYTSSVKQATGSFPLDRALLRDNAIVATAYMWLGVLLGFAFHLTALVAVAISAAVVVIAILLAPRWLRQKIIWQKAAIPYLFRLADAAPTIDAADAAHLNEIINAAVPPATAPCQVIVGGPIGSGRTAMAAGIATEFAFKNRKVRFLSLDCLLEFAAHTTATSFPDDPGPTTISYWPWSEAEVVIVDGVGPVIAADVPNRAANIDRFKRLLQSELDSVAGVLKQCHTIWVLGDLRPPPPTGELSGVLEDFAQAVTACCESAQAPLVIELDDAPPRLSQKGGLLRIERTGPQATRVKRVWRVSAPLSSQ